MTAAHLFPSSKAAVRLCLIYALILGLASCQRRQVESKPPPPDYSLATLKGHTDPVTAVLLVETETRIISAGRDGRIILWDLHRQTKIKDYVLPDDSIRAAAVTADGRYLAVGTDRGRVLILLLPDLALQQAVEAHAGAVYALAFDPTGQYLATGGRDRLVKIWPTATWTGATELTGAFERINVVAFSPDGQKVLAGSGGKGIMVWRLGRATPERASFEYGGWIYALLSDPGSGLIAAGGSVADLGGQTDGRVKVWSYPNGQELLSFSPHRLVTSALILLPGAQSLITSSKIDGVIRVWESSSGEARGTLIGHSEGVTALAVTADGRFLVSGGEDNLVKLWLINSALQLTEGGQSSERTK